MGDAPAAVARAPKPRVALPVAPVGALVTGSVLAPSSKARSY